MKSEKEPDQPDPFFGSLANEMIRRQARYGVVTMGGVVGQGAAGLLELCD